MKNLLNLGKVLNRAEQKQISGGRFIEWMICGSYLNEPDCIIGCGPAQPGESRTCRPCTTSNNTTAYICRISPSY